MLLGKDANILKLLKNMQENNKKKNKIGKRSAANPQTEREAWRKHFASVSQGRGLVNDRVWDSVPTRESILTWMGETPQWEEMQQALKKMPTGKAPGDDGIAVEMMKYASDDVHRRIYSMICEMWTSAASAEEGEEAKDWPKE